MDAQASPRITRLTWGSVEVEGLGRLRDAKLWPGGGRDWNWRETGTHHVPGIQVADVEELIERGCELVVLSRGQELALQTRPETLVHLEAQGVRFEVAETGAAVELYNAAAEAGQRVGGLFHSTC